MSLSSRTTLTLLACSVLFSTTPIAASQSAEAPRKGYQALFKPRDIRASAAAALEPARAETSVQPTCKMRVVPADPSIDPKIKVFPGERDVRYTIRLIPPSCK
jgi:hypothetical protein